MHGRLDPKPAAADADDGPELDAAMASIGTQIRSLRQSSGMTIEELSAQSGVSSGSLSQLERGIGNPSFNSLARIAHALGTPIAELVHTGPRRSPVVRRQDRRVLDLGSSGESMLGAVHELLTPSLDQRLEVVQITAPPGYSTEDSPFSHAGEEFGIILSGCHEVHVDGQTYLLEEGDSISYPSTTPHWYRNPGPDTVKAVWVMTPPTSPTF